MSESTTPISLALQQSTEFEGRQGVRVKVFADGSVTVIMYQFVNHQVVGKFCLSDDGTWRRLAESEAATQLSDVVRQQLENLPDGTPWEWS